MPLSKTHVLLQYFEKHSASKTSVSMPKVPEFLKSDLAKHVGIGAGLGGLTYGGIGYLQSGDRHYTQHEIGSGLQTGALLGAGVYALRKASPFLVLPAAGAVGYGVS